MNSAENPTPEELSGAAALPASQPPTLAPAWHTALLIGGIIALSVAGSSRFTAEQQLPGRLATYAATAGMELLLLGWVLLGLRLRRVSLRSVIGAASLRPRSIARDLGIALVFWLISLMVLGSLGFLWTRVQSAITHQPAVHSPFLPGSSETKTASKLARIAPQTPREVAGWALLCVFVGFVEELVFRGYLQGQFIAWTHGSNVAGVLFSAILFGAAHGYQGLRNMVLLSVFGALFSLLALYRRGLRPCMFAHAWQDLFAGIALGILHSRHLV
ncbi:MAG TPA: CPBP family intramembrane glutamic endopeptidase [Terracidiphilus sp.]|nr:CPBP family intramembrane glutamic endopeptidase [Terracidiphilus sp.]